MYTTRLIALIGLTVFAQGVLANTIWLKDQSTPDPQVCKNSASGNPDQIIGYGGVSRDGTGFTLTIDNPPTGTVTPATGECQKLPMNLNANPAHPNGDPIVFTGSLTPKLSPIHMWKKGTKDRMECLDQGDNFTGVTGSVVTGSGTNEYTIIFSYEFTDGCDFQTQQPNGDGLPKFKRTVVITQKQGNSSPPIFTGNYYLYDVKAIPEPGTIILVFAGLLGLATLSRLRIVQRSPDNASRGRPS